MLPLFFCCAFNRNPGARFSRKKHVDKTPHLIAITDRDNRFTVHIPLRAEILCLREIVSFDEVCTQRFIFIWAKSLSSNAILFNIYTGCSVLFLHVRTFSIQVRCLEVCILVASLPGEFMLEVLWIFPVCH